MSVVVTNLIHIDWTTQKGNKLLISPLNQAAIFSYGNSPQKCIIMNLPIISYLDLKTIITSKTPNFTTATISTRIGGTGNFGFKKLHIKKQWNLVKAALFYGLQ